MSLIAIMRIRDFRRTCPRGQRRNPQSDLYFFGPRDQSPKRARLRMLRTLCPA